MSARTSVDFRCLTISANAGKREMEDGRYHRAYTVTVASDATGLTRRFTFHDSIHNEERGLRGLAGDDLLYAFRCFVDDAATGQETFADFCGDYGYDEDSRAHHATWKACKAARDKFRALWHSHVDPTDILQELSEMGIE